MERSTTVFWIIILLNYFHQESFSARLRCYRDTFSNYEVAQLEDPETLTNSSDPCIDLAKCTVIYVFGFTGNPNGFAVSTLIPTLISLRTCNVLLLDWMEEASGGLFGPLLGYPLEAVPATEQVGKQFGEALIKLINVGLNKDIHIIGHSLGAHLSCYAGRYTKGAGYTVPRLTALDPARLEFDPPVKTEPVDTTCAEFVDAVHCDPGGYAMNRSVGHVDFWPNYNEFVNGDRRQPGCKMTISPIDLATQGNICNHNRCVELYNVSLTDHKILEGELAENYQNWLQEAVDNDTDINYIGPLVDKRKDGNFYLSTSAVYPFGQGPAGLKP